MRVISRVLYCFLVTPAALGLTVGSASAETWQHEDAHEDAASVEYTDGAATYAIDPTNESADVTQVAVRHTAHHVAVDLHLRDLEAAGYRNVTASIRTDSERYSVLASAGPDDSGSVMLLDEEDFVGCRDMWARFRPKRDQIHVRVARACLDHPRWVRASVSFSRFDVNGQTWSDEFQDDAMSTGEYPAPTTWSPRLRADPPKPRAPLTLHAGYGWATNRPVGGEMADAMAVVEIGAARGVVIEDVHAPFGSGVRTVGKRFARTGHGWGGALVHEWPLTGDDRPRRSIPVRGAHLTRTGEHGSWVLILGYRVSEPGRHLRPTITIDYRVGNEHLSVTSETPGLICAGRALRDRPCHLTGDELGRATLRSAPWTSTGTPSSSS